MKRAIVLIGVSTTGGLDVLQAVESGVADMKDWAERQEIDAALIFSITDSNGAVTVSQIFKTVSMLAGRGDIEQLIIYFSGHGAFINGSEHWLLSDAPDEANAAIDLGRNDLLAQRSGFSHIVFISDACRVPASASIQFQNIKGSDIFPNLAVVGSRRTKPVDIFYGSVLGDPANEVNRDGKWVAAYTDALIKCLDGDPDELKEADVKDPAFSFVRPRRVKDHLDTVTIPPNQVPDARVCSGTTEWLARIQTPPEHTKSATPPDPTPAAGEPRRSRDISKLVTPPSTAGRPSGRPSQLPPKSRAINLGRNPPAVRTGFNLEQCAAQLDRADGRSVRGKGGVVALDVSPGQPEGVLLTLEDGCSAILPAIEGYLVTVRYGAGVLTVRYDPSPGWAQKDPTLVAELGQLRNLVEAANRVGILRLNLDAITKIDAQMRASGIADPELVLRLGFAYHELALPEKVAGLLAYMEEQLSLRLFDLVLLCDAELGRVADPLLAFPLFRQSWRVLDLFPAQVPDAMEPLGDLMRPSLWSLYEPAGTQLLKKYLSRPRPDFPHSSPTPRRIG